MMQRAAKPPPPVPPRPSKSVVKEALARRGGAPTRSAPPPPQNGVVKSSSAYAVNIGVGTPLLERSLSSETNQSSRPVVYQSPNARGVASAKADALRDKPKSPEAKEGDDATSRCSTLEKRTVSTEKSSNCSSTSSSNSNSLDKKWDKMLNDRNHVNTLIDEMFASVLEVSSNCEDNNKHSSKKDNRIIINNRASDEEDDKPVPTTVIVITDEKNSKSNASTTERKVKFSDKMNHEFLIEELQHMKEDQDKIMKRQRKPSKNIFEENKINNDVLVNGCKMIESDEDVVKMNTCHITIEDSSSDNEVWVDYDRISKMSHLHGLPPLPKSLSGFGLSGGRPPPSPARAQRRQDNSKVPASLDAQLAILRREMYSLRQQDLSLLSQLWSLNESIQDFRAILQEQDGSRGGGSPPPPPLSPAPSSGDEEEYYSTAGGGGYRPQGGRRTSASSAASGSVG